ncbi:hypothetical protein BI344_22165 [Chromobacterium sphagni]|uniref:Uncharacterized protein n=1 Tax=Chromobacterium sphagni TaxID=1903179 RepID=A0ABX3C6Y2_9NEIS|nr:hypothetical protein BI344_22165 [Chromobacterium sphagni]
MSLIFFYLLRQYSPSIQFLPLSDVATGMGVSTQLLFWMWASLIGFYIIFGIADFSFQRYNTTKQLMMSLEDIKQEFKNSEGNPEIKQKRKEAHREIQSGSLADNVSKSTAVVRNPPISRFACVTNPAKPRSPSDRSRPRRDGPAYRKTRRKSRHSCGGKH